MRATSTDISSNGYQFRYFSTDHSVQSLCNVRNSFVQLVILVMVIGEIISTHFCISFFGGFLVVLSLSNEDVVELNETILIGCFHRWDGHSGLCLRERTDTRNIELRRSIGSCRQYERVAIKEVFRTFHRKPVVPVRMQSSDVYRCLVDAFSEFPTFLALETLTLALVVFTLLNLYAVMLPCLGV